MSDNLSKKTTHLQKIFKFSLRTCSLFFHLFLKKNKNKKCFCLSALGTVFLGSEVKNKGSFRGGERVGAGHRG